MIELAWPFVALVAIAAAVVVVERRVSADTRAMQKAGVVAELLQAFGHRMDEANTQIQTLRERIGMLDERTK